MKRILYFSKKKIRIYSRMNWAWMTKSSSSSSIGELNEMTYSNNVYICRWKLEEFGIVLYTIKLWLSSVILSIFASLLFFILQIW